MSEKTMKKFVSLLLAFVMLITTLTIVPLNTQAADGSVVKRITVVKGKDINDIQYGGSNVLHSSAWWIDEDGTKYPAFCVDPNKAGPGEIAAGQYDLNISGAETNEKIAAILNNSIPYKTYQELGVANEEEAYAATKAAIWCVIGVSNYTDPNKWDTLTKPQVKKLFDKLVGLANSNPAPVQAAVYGSAKVDQEPILDGEYYKQTFKIAETSNSGKHFETYKVELTGEYPSGTIITDVNGNTKNTFAGDEHFVIKIPAAAVPQNGKAEANVKISATLFSNVILLGKPTDGMDGKVQDMEIAMPRQPITITAKMEVGDTSTPPPDTPPTLIVKYDEETGARLPGAQFAIYVQSNTARPVAEGVTDANGEFGATLKPGTYVIKELNPPPGYMISDKTQPERVIVVKDSDEQITIKVDNIKLPKLTIRKIDSITKQPVAGAVFEIKLADGTSASPRTVTTDANGEAVIENLKADRYVVTEISVPQPYILNSEPQFVTLEGGDKKVLLFENQKKPSIKVVKYDEKTGTPLANAQFSIYKDGNPSTPIFEGKTNAQGEISTGVVEPGTYIVKEINPPPGYMVSDKTQAERTIIVKADDGEVVVKVDNVKLPKLTIKKVDKETQTPIAGAVFDVSLADGTSAGSKTVTTDASGKAVLEDMKADRYIVKEVSVPSPYIVDPTPQPVTLEGGDEKELIFQNEKKPSIKIIKYDEKTATPLADAQFAIYKGNDTSKPIFEGVTDAKGEINTGIVEPGSYTIKEINPPPGYMISNKTEAERKIEVKGNDGEVVVKFDNVKLPKLTIKKVDKETQAPIAGAVFDVSLADGTSAGSKTVTTDASGKAVLEDMKADRYIVKEVSVPSPYILDSTPQPVTLEGGDEKELIFQNEKKPSIKIIKYDEKTATPLADAQFAIYKKANMAKPIFEGVTDANGEIKTGVLEPGFYTIKEINPPPGYMISDKTQAERTVEVKGDDGEVVVKVDNVKLPVLTIKKIDTKTKQPVPGTIFDVSLADSTSAGSKTVTTDANGEVKIEDLAADRYVVKEKSVPEPYILDTTPQFVTLEGGDEKTLIFENPTKPWIKVIKYDEVTGEPLAGSQFAVYEQKDTTRPVIEGKTDADGIFKTDYLEPGTYTVKEINPTPGYMISDKTQPERTIIAKADDGEIVVKVDNIKLPWLVVRKTDGTTNKGIPNTTYKIEYENPNGGLDQLGTYKTDENGMIVIPSVKAGWYIITETLPAQGYQRPTNPVTRLYLAPGDNAYTQTAPTTPTTPVTPTAPSGTPTITSGKDYAKVGDIINYPLNSIVIKKSDANTGEMLEGATFEVIRTTTETSGTNGTVVCTVTTDNSGVIVITGLEAGAYAVREINAPQNYIIAETDLQTVNLKADGTSVVEVIFRNYPYGAINISKVDGTTKAPLEGAEFKVTEANGALVGTFTTDANGNILIPNLKPGSYVVEETKAPEGYILTGDTRTVEIGTSGATIPLAYSNYKKGGLLIRKYDATTKELLAGAEFKVERADGTVVGTANGIFKTDESGIISIPGLDNGTYIITETKAPDGYAIGNNPVQTIVIDKVQTYTVDFYNYQKIGVQIIKIDSETRQPLMGAEFQIWNVGASSSTSVAAGTPAGVLVGTYTTDVNGVINVVLPAGVYEVLETKAPNGYILDKHKQDIVVKDGEQTSVTFTNTKAPDGTIVVYKTDAKTGDPIKGVKFEIRRQNGELIKQGETDKNGKITVTGLEEGTYYVRETKAAEGYQADSKDHEVVLGKSGFVQLDVENTPLSGLRLKKIDSITKKGIYGVEFALYDKNGKIVGNYFTDNKGIIDFDAELKAGRYTIKEITPADGYYPDNKPRTVEFKAGKVTEIIWENTPQWGQIRIKKVSGDYNENSALPKGTPLQGAVFEVYNWKTKNVVDRIESDYYGIATTKPLPIGRYIVKEVQAPKFYKINPQELDVTIEFATQIVDLTVENHAANISVTIDKVGPYEVMPGQQAIYTIKNVRNTSSVPLSDFYWRDIIPTSAGRVEKLITGTYNQQGRYKVIATTSAGNTKVLADNLDTAKNNVVLCSPAAVGLSGGEYITSVTLMFGTVQPGFAQVLDAKVYLNVNKTGLPNGYQFANKVDVGGRYGGEWATGNSTWITTVYNPTKTKLPKTGW